MTKHDSNSDQPRRDTMTGHSGLTAQQIIGIDDSHVRRTDLPGDRYVIGHPQMTTALEQMIAAAASDNINLTVVSGFRDFAHQLSIWNRKFAGQLPVLDLTNRPLKTELLTERDMVSAIMLWSALPGSSRHHWGTDIDVYDGDALAAGRECRLVSEEFAGGGMCGAVSKWLSANMLEFGFYRPYQKYTGGVGPEPWHLSYSPLAEKIEAEFPLQELFECLDSLAEDELFGKYLILENFDLWVERFMLNINPEPPGLI